jgi:hypothetical protein
MMVVVLLLLNEVLNSTDACGSLTDYEGFVDGSIFITNSKGVGVNEVINLEDLVDVYGSNSEGFTDASGNEIAPFEKDEDILHPVLGMEFDSVSNTYFWYKDYTIKSGFAIVKRSNHKKEEACYLYAFVCSKCKKIEERDLDKPP